MSFSWHINLLFTLILSFLISCEGFDLLLDNNINYEILYNGESMPYQSGNNYDLTSTISNSTESPYSGSNHIRIELLKDDFSCVYYEMYGNGNNGDLSNYTNIVFMAKANSNRSLAVMISYDSTSSDEIIINLTTTYQQFTIPIESFGNDVTLDNIKDITFQGSIGTIDIDDIGLEF